MAQNQNKRQAKKEAIAKTAAMFEVTAMSPEELSAAAKFVEDKSGNELDNIIENVELEKKHAEEIEEAKALGLSTDPIIESTNSEIIRDLERKIEESQNRYLEAVEDKNAFKQENEQLSKEISSLKKTITSISSEYDCYKTDSSREITNYKINIDDLNEKIEIFERNESNYKLEVAKLKAEITNLEEQLENIPEAKNQKNESKKSRILPMYSSKSAQNIKSVPPSTNGYSSWN
jgi:predicted RNase H-like nuclease (RuvC/YqgF family)